MSLKFNYLILFLFVILSLHLLVVTLKREGEEMKTTVPNITFEWRSFSPTLKRRIAPEAQYKFRDIPHQKMTLDLTFLPQFHDPKLHESVFIIEVFDFEYDIKIYEGPFKERLFLTSVPYRQKEVSIRFWAFHEGSQTCSSWASKNTYSIFIGKPLYIELYREYNKDADAQFKISSVNP